MGEAAHLAHRTWGPAEVCVWRGQSSIAYQSVFEQHVPLRPADQLEHQWEGG